MANPYVFAVTHTFPGKLSKPPEKPTEVKPETVCDKAPSRQPASPTEATKPT